jgi:arylsulfatase A-like enzyme
LQELVSLIDLPPTLLDAAGIAVPEHMAGRSILPLAQKRPVDWPEEVFVQISEAQVGRAVRTHRWKYGVDAPDKKGSQHPGSEKYVEQYLYDLQCDPYELRNLIGLESHRQVADVMRDRLIRRMGEAGEEAPMIVPAETQRSNQRRVTAEEARQ